MNLISCRRRAWFRLTAHPACVLLVNEHVVKLLLDACRRSGAARVTAIVPYLGYTGQLVDAGDVSRHSSSRSAQLHGKSQQKLLIRLDSLPGRYWSVALHDATDVTDTGTVVTNERDHLKKEPGSLLRLPSLLRFCGDIRSARSGPRRVGCTTSSHSCP